MTLNNNTVFRVYLEHVRSLAIQMAGLYFEYMNHPDTTEPPPLSAEGKKIQKAWEALGRDVEKVLHVKLRPWNHLGKLRDIHLRKTAKPTERVSFCGVDRWNRPIFRSLEFPDNYFGSTDKLFLFEDTEETVLAKVTEEDLLFFGNHFGCEPEGTQSEKPLEIVHV